MSERSMLVDAERNHANAPTPPELEKSRDSNDIIPLHQSGHAAPTNTRAGARIHAIVRETRCPLKTRP